MIWGTCDGRFCCLLVRCCCTGRDATFATDTRAREEQADKLFREIIEIADDASGDYVTTSDGKRIVDHENIQRSRKWAAARLAPKKSDSDPLPKALLVQCSARN